MELLNLNHFRNCQKKKKKSESIASCRPCNQWIQLNQHELNHHFSPSQTLRCKLIAFIPNIYALWLQLLPDTIQINRFRVAVPIETPCYQLRSYFYQRFEPCIFRFFFPVLSCIGFKCSFHVHKCNSIGVQVIDHFHLYHLLSEQM